MKRLLILVLFFVSIFSTFAGEQTTKKNPFGLEIVQTISQYDSCLIANKNNELVDLEKVITDIVLDIRYATTNNFTKQVVYTKPKAFLRRDAAEALHEVQRQLHKVNLGLVIYDAYRPYQATIKFYEIMPDSNFCANPKYGSRHNRGCAVDVTLMYMNNGKIAVMQTDYDDFTNKSSPNYMDLPKEVIQRRKILINIMAQYGFTVFPTEWWHFDFKDWQNFKLMDISFEELEKKK